MIEGRASEVGQSGQRVYVAVIEGRASEVGQSGQRVYVAVIWKEMTREWLSECGGRVGMAESGC